MDVAVLAVAAGRGLTGRLVKGETSILACDAYPAARGANRFTLSDFAGYVRVRGATIGASQVILELLPSIVPSRILDMSLNRRHRSRAKP